MPPITPATSQETAIVQLLRSHLATQSGIDWDYLQDAFPATVKGGVWFLAEKPSDLSYENQMRVNRLGELQIRIALMGSSEDTVHDTLWNWNGWLESEMLSISQKGISGTYSGKTIAHQLLGIKLGAQGSQLQVRSSLDAQSVGTRGYQGAVYSYWVFDYTPDHVKGGMEW